MKVGIDMGTTSEGTSASLDIEELLATRLLVQGNSGSGKVASAPPSAGTIRALGAAVHHRSEGDFVTLADKSASG